MTRPDLTIETSPWNRAESYRPDPVQMLADNDTRLQVHPPIDWRSLGIAIASVALCIFCFAYFSWQYVR